MTADKDNQFSDEAIRRFLLGRLNPTEQSPFEERLFADGRLETRVRLAECQLADDFAFERLSAADQKLFEKKFLVSADRKQKLKVSRALSDRFATLPAPAPASEGKATFAERLKLLFALNQPARRFAFGIVTLLLLIGSVWLVVKEPRIKESIKQRILAKRSPAPSATREAAHSSDRSPDPVHQADSSPMPSHEVTASPAIISVTLSPASSRESGTVSLIDLPKGELDIIRFQLTVSPNQTGVYRAEVFTVEGQSVFSSNSLKPSDSRAEIDFDLPARLLKAGDYQIKLTPIDDGSKEGVAGYYFRVQ